MVANKEKLIEHLQNKLDEQRINWVTTMQNTSDRLLWSICPSVNQIDFLTGVIADLARQNDLYTETRITLQTIKEEITT